MTVEQRRDESSDQFPVGMRVLAVDDDLICLRVLESLLRKCQYHVTTTNQAVTALRLLRENKDKFDLVISDVHMPDMDGFKLLELVGLEMDLPVIMLSANGDTKLVMNGITHGACDYLLKPVRIEELKNIWQHVIRRKKLDSRDQSASNDQDKKSGEAGHGSIQNGNCDQDGKLNKKRKDQNDEDDEEHDESRHENEDPSTQKKPRVVWSVELHRKFVAAVNQLGLEKAVPKKILELMNVEKLTRENVASHLQKYRLYLKRISSVANQQANMVAALGGPDSPYLRMGSVNFHNFNGSSQFPPFHNNALRSFPPAGVFGRLNTPAGLGLHGLSPSGMGHGQVRNAVTDCAKFQPVILPGDQTGNVLQGMPTSLEFDNLQDNKKGFVGVGGNSSANDTSRIYPISNLTDPKSSIGGSSNPLLGLPHSSVVLQPQDNQSHDRFGLNSEPPSNLLDRDRCNSSWPSAVPAQTNSSSADCHRSRMLPDIRPRDESAPSALLDVSPSVRVHNQTRYSRMDTQCQAALLNELDVLDHMDFIDGSIGSTFALQSGCPSAHGADLRGATPLLQGFTGFGLVAKPGSDSLAAQHNVVPNSAMDTTVKAKQGHLMEQGRAFGGYAGVGAGSLEDIVSAVMKREQDGGINKAWRPVV